MTHGLRFFFSVGPLQYLGLRVIHLKAEIAKCILEPHLSLSESARTVREEPYVVHPARRCPILEGRGNQAASSSMPLEDFVYWSEEEIGQGC